MPAMPAVDGESTQPVAKRQKLANGSSFTKNGSRIFTPYRTLGLVSPTPVPFTSVPLGRTTFQITTSVGRTIHTYDLRRGLKLVFLSRPRTPEEITATCAFKDVVLVAWGGFTKDGQQGIWMFKRGKLVAELEVTNSTDDPVISLLCFGSWIVACGRRTIEVWKADTLESYATLTPSSPDNTDALTGQICTLPTFLNKIFVGRKDGNVEVWNLSTGRLIHTMLPPSADKGSVTALEPTPALSVIAIGYSDGSIILRDVESDTTVLEFNQGSPVTSITFRTDGMGSGNDGREEGIMATSCARSGNITFWDLNEGGKVKGILRNAHDISTDRNATGINKVEFLAGQPVLISSGPDNALKSWIFDEVPFSPLPRPLHSRGGHAAPITRLMFTPTGSDDADAVGKWILSASQDRTLWAFSSRKDGQSSELSQGQVIKKAKKLGQRLDDTMDDLRASEITSMACCLNRDGGMGSAISGRVWSNQKASNADETNQTGWESIVTTHRGDRFARTWSWGRRKAGRWAFETSDKTEASSVAITPCGTFAVVGSAGGSLDMFNLQSGIHRQRFPPRPNPSQMKQLRLEALQKDQEVDISLTAHTREITGVVVDSLNEHVISCSLDATVKIWDFTLGKLVDTINMPYGASVTAMRYNSSSGLVSLSCDDFCIRLVDIETRRIVRELWGAGGQLYDHCFSHDGRWIVACSTDSVIRIWDLSTGNLIDAFRTAKTCTSLAFSSSGEYLATGYSSDCGIEIWSNKSLYMHIPTHQIHDVYGIIDLSDTDQSGMGILPSDEQEAGFLSEAAEDDLNDDTTEAEQLSQELLTLSLVPRNRWETLLYLDTIKERNKPVEPPKQPEKAPFFLQSIDSNALGLKEDHRKATESRISKLELMSQGRSKFSALLSAAEMSNEENEAMIQELASLGPAAADLEIRSLQLSEFQPFVHALTQQLRHRADYELVNTWMTCFIRLYGDFVEEDEDLQDAILEWREALRDEEQRLSNVVGYCSGVIDFLRSGR